MVGAEYRFVSWVRTGVGALLEGETRTIVLDLGAAGTVSKPIAQLGPGDVTGLDPRAIVRTVPANGVTDFEPNLFPSVELAHPSIPWMLSPTSPTPTPWITLVVVEVEAGVALAAGPDNRRALTIEPPAALTLPELANVWAWSHAQEANTVGAPLDTTALSTSHGSARGRLVCARRLKSRTAYIAAIVPTFAAGVAAAFGNPVASGLAWTGGETSIRLPVYYSWQFSTGDDGDFVSLVKRLQPEVLDASVGHRAIDISDPHWGMPASPGAEIDIAGALYSSEWTPPAPPAAAVAIGAAIAAELDAAALPPANTAPTFAPPFYGAAASRVESMQAAPAWQRTLNTDVGERIAAGIGARVVRANLDRFLDAAWRAVGDSEAINHLIRHAELAAAITQRLGDKHLASLTSDGELLALARPLLARMKVAAGITLTAAVTASAMPSAALSASFRRLGRARGVIASRVATRTGALLEQIDTNKIVAAPASVLASGAAGFDEVSVAANVATRLAIATPTAVAASAQHWTSRVVTGPAMVARTATATAALVMRSLPGAEIHTTPPLVSELSPSQIHIDEFAAAARIHQRYIVEHLSRVSDVPTPLGLAGLRGQIAAQWTAAVGIVPLVASQITGVATEAIATFQQVTSRPVLEQPVIGALQTLSPSLIMPGVDAVLSNRMAIAAVNPTFVRALLVGANEELARELLWRRYPGALGHTWLQTFWGRVEAGPDGSPQPVPDIPAIETWPPEGLAPSPAQLVLLVRGDVLHRYPNALVYAVEAKWQGNFRVVGDGPPLLPAVATTLGPDIALFGFDLSLTTARGHDAPPNTPGWYLAVAEHPHEPRFGLAATPTASPQHWRDVAWSDVTPQDLHGEYLRLDGPLAQRAFGAEPDLRWGRDAAQLAAITLRRSTRVAMHASRLI